MCKFIAYFGRKQMHTRTLLRPLIEASENTVNKDGAGLYLNDHKGTDMLLVTSEPLYESTVLEGTINHKDTKAKLIMCHIRHATMGNKCALKCSHPYCIKDKYGVNWYFMHNGTIEYDNLDNCPTDSYKFFKDIINNINNDINPCDSIDKSFKLLEDNNIPYRANFALTNSINMYAESRSSNNRTRLPFKVEVTKSGSIIRSSI